MEDLRKLIREAPDFPRPGILFYDITTLLKDKDGLRGVIDGLKLHYQDLRVDVVLGIEARGFIFAPAVAYALGAGFVPVRKPKKLPAARGCARWPRSISICACLANGRMVSTSCAPFCRRFRWRTPSKLPSRRDARRRSNCTTA